MKLSKWKVVNGQIKLDGWFLASFKLQQGDAEAVKNGTGSISEESNGFDFSVTLGTDFKIARDKETGEDLIEITLQGNT